MNQKKRKKKHILYFRWTQIVFIRFKNYFIETSFSPLGFISDIISSQYFYYKLIDLKIDYNSSADIVPLPSTSII